MTEADRNMLRLAIETGGSPKTVHRWWYGEHVSPFANYALDAAAEKLKILSAVKARGKLRKLGAAVTKRRRRKP